jgi:hypothetical protein
MTYCTGHAFSGAPVWRSKYCAENGGIGILTAWPFSGLWILSPPLTE